MNIFSYLYDFLFNIMVFLYNITPGQDIGVAIILLTILVRIALYPMNTKSIKSQKQLQEIQPKIKEIQEKYKNDKETQAKKLMEFYQKNKINPFSGCLPLIVQFPILIALYYVFINGFKDERLSALYSFVQNPGHIDPVSFGLINLSHPNVFLAVLAGGLQYFQTKMLMSGKRETKRDNNKAKTPEEKTQEFVQSISTQMVYIMPALTFFFALSFPSALALYWATTTLFAIGQQYLIIRKQKIEMANT